MSPRFRSVPRWLAGTVSAGALLLGGTLAAPAAQAADPAPTLWACHPDRTPNPCFGSLKTTYLSSTVLQPRKVAKIEEPQNRADAPVDCFYVYPTVSSQLRLNATRSVTADVRSILNYQASRFSQQCRVFAPAYRQLTLTGILLSTTEQQQAGAALAYGDVRAAWREYLANENDGRGVVFIGHSQGAALLTQLLRDEVDDDPAMRAKMVSALLIGGNLAVKQGERTGGDFQTLPLCAAGDETGCVVAYSSYGTRPSRNTLFGRVDGELRRALGAPVPEGSEVACVNPAALSGDGGKFETFTRSEPFPNLIGAALGIMFFGLPPKAGTPWISPGERYTGKCVTSNGANVLMVRPAKFGTIVPIASPTPDWGLHLADMNLPMGNLQRVVDRQITAYAGAAAG